MVAIHGQAGNSYQLLFKDYHGSTRTLYTVALPNYGKTLNAKYKYDPWGQLISSTEYTPPYTDFKFQEKKRENGLDYFGARYYDSIPAGSSMRWISPDPVISGIYDPQSLNRYSFNRNDPVNRIDPDGTISSFDDTSFELGYILQQLGLEKFIGLLPGFTIWQTIEFFYALPGGFGMSDSDYLYWQYQMGLGITYADMLLPQSGQAAQSSGAGGGGNSGAGQSSNLSAGAEHGAAASKKGGNFGSVNPITPKQDPIVALTRWYTINGTTVGDLSVYNGETYISCYVLENANYLMPVGGSYPLYRHSGAKWQNVVGVAIDGHSAVLFHPGNYGSDGTGCFMPSYNLNSNGYTTEKSSKAVKDIIKYTNYSGNMYIEDRQVHP